MNLECRRYFYFELEKDDYSGDRWVYISDNGRDVEDVTLPLTKPLDDISVILEWESEEVELVSELVTYKSGEAESTKDTGEITGMGGDVAAYREVTDIGGSVRDVTTIVDEEAMYSFYVHRTDGEGTFGDAGAKVTVRVPGMPDEVVEVKPEIIGEYWYVFTIYKGKVNVLNYGVEGYSMY